jgi:hypothetical protein
MVMVDSSCEHQDRRMDAVRGARFNELGRKRLLRDYTRLTRLARVGALTPGTADYARAVGVGGISLDQLPPGVRAARIRQHTSPGYWRAVRSESKASVGASALEVAAARRSLGDMPLIVLTAGRTATRRPDETPEQAVARFAAWCAMHDEIAALSGPGERRTIEAGHGMPLETPDVVIGAVEEVLTLASAG